MSLSVILQKTRNNLLAATTLALAQLPLHADIISVKGTKYDVRKDAVVQVDSGKPLEDLDTLRKAIETDLIREEILHFDKLNLPAVEAYWKANELVLKTTHPVKEATSKGLEFFTAYLTGNLDKFTTRDLVEGVRDITSKNDNDLESAALSLFSQARERFEENVTIYKKIKSGETILDYDTAQRFLDNDRLYSAIGPAAKTLFSAAFIKDFKTSLLTALGEGAFNLDGDKLETILNKLEGLLDKDRALADFNKQRKTTLEELDSKREHFDQRKEAKVLYTQGRALVDNGKYTEAIPDLEESIKLNPNDARTHNCLGFAYGKIGDPLSGIKEFKVAINVDPFYDEPYANLVTCFSKLQKHTEALPFAQRYIQFGTNKEFVEKCKHYVEIASKSSTENK